MYLGEIMDLDKLFSIADQVSDLSDDQETKVGALAIPLAGDLSGAANSFVEGNENTDLPRTRPGKYEFMIHAEVNLILHAARYGYSLDKSTVVCTLSPCQNCLRMLYQVGVREIYFRDKHQTYNPVMRDIKITEEKVDQYTKLVLTNHEV